MNATNPKYSKYYNMLKHVTEELPAVLAANNLPVVSVYQITKGYKKFDVDNSIYP